METQEIQLLINQAFDDLSKGLYEYQPRKEEKNFPYQTCKVDSLKQDLLLLPKPSKRSCNYKIESFLNRIQKNGIPDIHHSSFYNYVLLLLSEAPHNNNDSPIKQCMSRILNIKKKLILIGFREMDFDFLDYFLATNVASLEPKHFEIFERQSFESIAKCKKDIMIRLFWTCVLHWSQSFNNPNYSILNKGEILQWIKQYPQLYVQYLQLKEPAKQTLSHNISIWILLNKFTTFYERKTVFREMPSFYLFEVNHHSIGGGSGGKLSKACLLAIETIGRHDKDFKLNAFSLVSSTSPTSTSSSRQTSNMLSTFTGSSHSSFDSFKTSSI